MILRAPETRRNGLFGAVFGVRTSGDKRREGVFGVRTMGDTEHSFCGIVAAHRRPPTWVRASVSSAPVVSLTLADPIRGDP